MEIRNLFNDIYFKRKILLTGHTGFKGSWLMLWLEKMGAEVCGYSLRPNTNPAHYSLLNLNSRSEIEDIRNIIALKKLIQTYQPEIVFHLAAQPIVRYSYANPIETYEINVMGTLNVLEVCRYSPSVKAIVIITTDKCYENKEWVWGYRESDPMGGYDPYSSSKGCVELLINSYRNSYFNINNYQKNHSILLASARAGNVIGGGDWAEDRLIPDVMQAALKNKKVQIRNPLATRPWQHVLEPLSGYLMLGQKLLEQNTLFASAWNFGPDDSGNKNVAEILRDLKKIWGKIDFEVDKNENPHEAGLLKLDCSKANQLLKWKENLTIQETLEYTVEWYKKYYLDDEIISLQQIKKYIKKALINNLNWASNSQN
jgi:CDP-glucose 4,6-dehydratase